MNILVVDDSRLVRRVIAEALKRIGFVDDQILQACDGVEAMQMVDASRPDLILSDWNMPRMNGLELLQNTRAAGHTALFGLITSDPCEETQKQAIDAGASFFLSKPFQFEELQLALGQLTKRIAESNGGNPRDGDVGLGDLRKFCPDDSIRH